MAYFNRSIPKSLDDCMREDPTVSNLHFWADRLEKWGQNLLWILVIIGCISIISDIAAYDDIGEEIFLFKLLLTVLIWGLCAFVEYCTYNAISLLIRALAIITHSTLVSANVAIYESDKNDKTKEPAKAVANTAPRTNVGGLAGSMAGGMKRCSSCGALQSAKRKFCTDCGELL